MLISRAGKDRRWRHLLFLFNYISFKRIQATMYNVPIFSPSGGAMQWLKKHFLQLRYSIIANYARRQLSKSKPNRQLCEDLLNELSVDRFRLYRPAQGMGVVVQTRYTDIESLTQKLKETTRLIREEKMIPVDWVTGEETTISIDRFMTSKDGYYLDVGVAVARYKEAGLKLCQLMRDSDTATFGLPEHNLRMLTKLFINLRDVTTTLIEVSLA